MNTKLMTLAVLLTGASMAMAQNTTPPAGGMGGGMRDPAERFKQLDSNSDGKVTSAEFTTGMQNMRGPQGGQPGAGNPPSPPPGMPTPAERFKQIDKNSDGSLTLEEFTTAMQQMRGGGQGGPPPAK